MPTIYWLLLGFYYLFAAATWWKMRQNKKALDRERKEMESVREHAMAFSSGARSGAQAMLAVLKRMGYVDPNLKVDIETTINDPAAEKVHDEAFLKSLNIKPEGSWPK